MKRQKNHKGTHRTMSEMYGHISSWESSGELQREYMLRHGLSKSVFGYWLRKYRQDQQNKSSSFVAVTVPAQELPEAVGFARLRLTNGSELILHEAVSAAYLRELLGW